MRMRHVSRDDIAQSPVFRREGEYWTIAFAGSTCRLRDSVGLHHIAYLLSRPGEQVAAVELVAAGEPAQGDLDSPPTLITERARVRVTHAIRHTLHRIAEHHADLNEHLRATIRTGTTCAYLPDPRKAVQWEL